MVHDVDAHGVWHGPNIFFASIASRGSPPLPLPPRPPPAALIFSFWRSYHRNARWRPLTSRCCWRRISCRTSSPTRSRTSDWSRLPPPRARSSRTRSRRSARARGACARRWNPSPGGRACRFPPCTNTWCIASWSDCNQTCKTETTCWMIEK